MSIRFRVLALFVAVSLADLIVCLAFISGCWGAAPASAPPDQMPASTPAYSLGDTSIRPADGMAMVYVPGGEFRMGKT